MLVSAMSRASLHPALIRLPLSCSLHTGPVTRAKLYSAKHEWVELVGGADSDTVRVGVTKYAADALGDVVYAQLPREEEDAPQRGRGTRPPPVPPPTRYKVNTERSVCRM